jgi:hypothetical protein
MGFDEATRQRFQRATELIIGNSGTQLLQTFINRTVQMLTLREFGVQAVLDRRQGSGDAEYINRRTAGTTGGEWVTDTDNATEEVGSYAQESFSYKTLLTRGKVTRKLQATGRSYADVLALEMMAKAEDFSNALENGLIQGNLLGVAANAPTGFLTQIQRYNSFALDQVVACGTQGALTADELDQAIDLVKGSANRSDLVIVGSYASLRQVNAIMQAQQVFNDVTEIAAGFRVRTYDGIPLVVSTSMPDDLTIDSAGLITAAGGTARGLMILNKRYCYIPELTPTTVMPLAKSSSQYDEFDMYWDGASVIANPLGASMIVGV